MRTITFKADDHVDDWLEQQARALRVSKSKIVRDAVEKTRREKAALSCHDLMQAACGSLRSGVTDLATNKKHLKGFGAWKR
jgi:predicted transcriptional regulator